MSLVPVYFILAKYPWKSCRQALGLWISSLRRLSSSILYLIIKQYSKMYQKKEINEAKFKGVQHNLGGTALVSLPVNSLMQQQQNFLSSVKIPILKNGKKIHILLNA